MQDILNDPDKLRRHIQKKIYLKTSGMGPLYGEDVSPDAASSVLFLMGVRDLGDDRGPRPCIILNKRSESVPQPGDLCFPGGSPSLKKDKNIARLLGLPFSPLTRWAYWMSFCRKRPRDAAYIPRLLATSLREAKEEMGLKSLGVQFLGPLPPQALKMFDHVICPMVGWIAKQKNFTANWEVEKIITIALEDFFNPESYAAYHLVFSPGLEDQVNRQTMQHPCFMHRNGEHPDILWGATYRIVMTFLDWVFDFHPPKMDALPKVEGELDDRYLTGNGRR